VSVGEDTIDTRRLIENIRRHLSPMIDQLPPTFPLVADPSSRPAVLQTDRRSQDLTLLRGRLDPFEIRFKSHRRVFGWLVVAAKTLLRQLLTPVLEWQSAHNATTCRLFESLDHDARAVRAELDLRARALETELGHRFSDLDRRVVALESELGHRVRDIERRTATLETQVSTLETQVEHRRQAMVAALDTSREQMAAALEASQKHTAAALEASRAQMASVERKLRRILHDRSDVAAPVGPETPAADVHTRATSGEDLAALDFDYFAFEDRYRGSEAEIKRHHRRYLRHVVGQAPVLDLGCGRGEFLELLNEAGIAARGVDLDLDMVLLCRDKGLDVAHDDVFRCLDAVTDASLGAVFSSQLIEHFTPAVVVRLVDIVRRKLRPDGVLIFETINPRCLTVFARSFFLDPSHVWPFHPETMRFILETRGFTGIETEFFNPVVPSAALTQLLAAGPGVDVENTNRCLDLLNELLFSHQDYAIVCRNPLAGASDARARSR
jgi:SAM-dependent methyltransferase